MIDIVKRCRNGKCGDKNCGPCADLEDAADTIEQLRAELAEIKPALDFWEKASATGTKNRMYDYRMRLSAEVSENKKLRAELAALREQEPVRFERRSFRKGELFRDWHTSTASEVKSIGERTRFVNELGEEWIHETRKLYTTPQPAIPEGFALVPLEPTPAMMEALLKGVRLHSYVRKGMTINEYSYHQDGWNAMLAAKETNHEN